GGAAFGRHRRTLPVQSQASRPPAEDGARRTLRAAGRCCRGKPDALSRDGSVLGQHALGPAREFRLARRRRASHAGIAACGCHAPAAAEGRRRQCRDRSPPRRRRPADHWIGSAVMLTRRKLLNGLAAGASLGLGGAAAWPGAARATSSALFGAPSLRNIHIILEESFWDPAPLTAAGLKESPIDPRFAALWAQSGYTRALSPAFAGQTANAEFEILCGFPLDRVSVKFEEGFNDKIPALPHLLKEIGYRTVASHPNAPGFWNRKVAYNKLGFETFWALPDFTQDDMAG